MSFFDVFNGDADGLCALHQLRLAEPRAAQLVTGVKRDNKLLARVRAQAGDAVTVLDISLAHNRGALAALLERGVSVRYFDHHYAGEVPQHALFEPFIDTSPEACTSVIVDRFLAAAQRPWAVVGAFGDNLAQTAALLAAPLEVPAPTLAQWRELGECLNYNAYGESEADLVYAPGALFRMLQPYRDPSAFIDGESVLPRLRQARAEDMAQALAYPADTDAATATVHILPDEKWARRVIGSFGNHLAASDPQRAHAVLVPNGRGSLMVSLRAPRDAAVGADELCRRWGGGGRRLAAGVDDLPLDQVARFTAELLDAPAGAENGASRDRGQGR